MKHTCPHCGFDLTRDETLTLGRWRLVPRDAAYYDDVPVVTRATWLNIMLVLAREQGRALRAETLLNRVSDSDDPNVIAVQVSRLKKSLRTMGIETPIKARYCTGYYWNVA